MLFYVLIFVLSAVLLLWYWKTSNFWKNRNIRQINGTMMKFALGDRSLGEHIKEIYDTNDEHVGIFMGAQPALILKKLEDIQSVLTTDFQSFYNRGLDSNPDDILADNVLFIQDLQRWKCIRQKISPVFTSSKLKNMFYIMDKCARDFVDLVERNQDTRKESFELLSIYTTAALGAAVFGIDTKGKSTMDSPFIEMTKKSVEPSFANNMLFVFSSYFPGLIKMLHLKLFAEHEDFFIGAVKQVLESRRNDPGKKHDFIDMCIELQKQGLMRDPSSGYELEPTDEIMAAQAFFFFIAGSDTSATAMNYILLELASNPNILKRLHDEIDSIFGNDVQELTYNDVENLQYMDMVISEAIRKYPPIGFIQRKCTKATVLPASKVKMEKDTVAVIPVFAIHRDEKYYSDPEVFDPERFSPENVSNLKKFSYLPFGEGNRICIDIRQELTYNDVENLQYMDMVISEAIRKYPPIGFIQRKCTKATVLPASKVKMEKDTVAVIPIFAIHRDEKYYTDPEVFDPERFSPENVSNLKKFSYLPFGDGNRICIGNRFARLQLKVGLAWLLRKFTLVPQNYKPKKFEHSNFTIRDTKASAELIPRTK